MTAAAAASARVRGLAHRLGVGLAALGVPRDVSALSDAEAAGALLEAFTERVRRTRDVAELWLLLTLLCARFPAEDTVVAVSRMLRTCDGAELDTRLLALASVAGGPDDRVRSVDLVQGGVLVDVDHCATRELHTGIQEVVRRTVPRWGAGHELTLVAWWPERAAYRPLADHERDRVLRWYDGGRSDRAAPGTPEPDVLVVPWRCHVLVPETPDADRTGALAALGRFSGSRLGVVGYDCIPLVSPELIHAGLPDVFVRYLSMVKRAAAVAAISRTAAEEFRGFADMLAPQALPGPEVHAVTLPAGVPAPSGERVDRDGTPLVVCVGTFEARKNQARVLLAAERLWREGLSFRLRFIGGGGHRTGFDDVLARVRRAGRAVEVLTAAPGHLVQESYARARFSVFLSLHEGYGLPVVESLAHGTPVLTTGYGSTGDLAAGGGCLAVHPEDETAIEDAMRRLLLSDDLLRRLRAEAVARVPRTWDDYAAESWQVLVEQGGRG